MHWNTGAGGPEVAHLPLNQRTERTWVLVPPKPRRGQFFKNKENSMGVFFHPIFYNKKIVKQRLITLKVFRRRCKKIKIITLNGVEPW